MAKLSLNFYLFEQALMEPSHAELLFLKLAASLFSRPKLSFANSDFLSLTKRFNHLPTPTKKRKKEKGFNMSIRFTACRCETVPKLDKDSCLPPQILQTKR